MASENLSEKVSVNINSSTLSTIDLLVDNGYYSNRSDFINQALRSEIQKNQSTIDRIIGLQVHNKEKNNDWFLGISVLSADYIHEIYEAGGKLSITGYGVLNIDRDCPTEELFAVLKSVKVKGRVNCSPEVKAHYGLK